MADTANLEQNEEIEKLKKALQEKQQEMDQTIKSQEDDLRKTFQEQEMKWLQEKQRLEAQRRQTSRYSLLLKKHQQDYRQIKEANEICQAMGKNIRFKPCLIKQAYDPEGRKMTIAGGSANFQDEL